MSLLSRLPSPIRHLAVMKCLVLLAPLSLLLLAAPAEAQASVDVNTASRAQLESLPGVGPKIASDIIREREEGGPFASVDDLTRVPSLSPNLLNKIRDQVRVGSTGQVVIQDGKVVSGEVVRKVLMRYAGEPTVGEVQARAIEYMRVDPAVIDSWRVRARTAALAPRFDTFGQGTINRDLRTVTKAGDADVESQNDANGGRLTLRAIWDLNRLIFEPQEMAVAREGVRLANLRDRVLDQVTRRYFERRRLQVDLELTPPTDLGDRVKKELRLQELTADIDAFTGGWYSEKLKEAGRPAY